MSRIATEMSLVSLLAIVELKAIRDNGGCLTITRNDSGWTITLGELEVTGEALEEALENCIVPAGPKLRYKDWKGGKDG